MQENIQSQVVELYVDDIIPNRFQPREIFEDKALQELAMSIKEHGVIQPIIVRKLGDKYEIIAGERRYKANIMAGFTKIPAIIRNLDDKETAKVALLENLQRKNLSPIEEARTYQKILDLDSMTQEELGKTMGKSQAAVANKLRLLQLSDEVQEALLNNQISERHARSLLGVSDQQMQVQLLHEIINNKMTVRELDEKLKNLYGINITDDGTIMSAPKNVDRNISAGSNINIQDLKSQAEDIVPEVLQTNNLNSLLQGQAAPVEENPIETGPQFKFLDDFTSSSQSAVNSNSSTNVVPLSTPNVQQSVEISDDRVQIAPGLFIDADKVPNSQLPTDIPGMNNQTNQMTDEWATDSSNKELPIPNIIGKKEDLIVFDIRDAISAFRELANELEKNGIKVDLTEMDLENEYQINVKIDK